MVIMISVKQSVIDSVNLSLCLIWESDWELAVLGYSKKQTHASIHTNPNSHLLNSAAMYEFSGIFFLLWKCIRRGEFACRCIEMIVTVREHIDCASWVRRVEQKTMEEEEKERRRKNCWSMVDDTTERSHIRSHVHSQTHTTIQPWAWLLSPSKYTWRQFS